MRLTSAICFAIVATQAALAKRKGNSLAATQPVVGGYFLVDEQGPAKLKALADNAATIPINRLFVSFFRPDMVYIPGENSLKRVGLKYGAQSGDHGYAEVKSYIDKLKAGGVEVFLSLGGWSYNCWPYAYLRYAVAPYGGDNAEIIKKYGGGNIDNCNAGNLYCYACDPPSNGDTMGSFTYFPEPGNSETYKAAMAYVKAKNSGAVFHPELINGKSWTDPKTGKTDILPGTGEWSALNRDPYQDFVYLAKDLGVNGVDIDYEEFWHADLYKTGSPNCEPDGCTNYQTTYKYTAIMRDMQINIQSIYPTLKLSTAAAAVGAWSGTWWGGNLKGIWLKMKKDYPDVTNFILTSANAGGFNVMTYDISTEPLECPDANGVKCNLAAQVDFYMNTFKANGMTTGVYLGYEIGTPAYPDPAVRPNLLANLTATEFTSLLGTTQKTFNTGGFYWEMFKSDGVTGAGDKNIDVNSVSKLLCKQLTPGAARCDGNIPVPGQSTSTATTVGPSTTTNTVPTTTSTTNTKTTTTTVNTSTTTTPVATTSTTTATVPTTRTTKATTKTTTKTTAKTTTKTTTVGGSIADGKTCAVFGQWACANACQCSYGSGGLIWFCNPSTATC